MLACTIGQQRPHFQPNLNAIALKQITMRMTKHLGKIIRFLLYFSLAVVAIACTNTPSSQTNVTSTATLPENPTRVVALEWVYVEDLLALDIQPVGVADIAGYNEFVQIEPQIAETVVDVGTRQEPSLEAIAQLQPDLIIGVNLRHELIYNSLSAIAPTVLFDPYPAPEKNLSQFDEMEQTFLKIAELVNAREKGERVLQDMRSRFAKAETQLSNSTIGDRAFSLGQFVPGAPQIRLFNDNALAVQILEQIGLNNVWQGQPDPFGFNTVWLESLPKIEASHFFYISDDSNPYLKQLKDNPIWQNLAFVQNRRVYPIGGDTWIFGGPLSAQVFVDKVVDGLLSKSAISAATGN